MTRPERPRAERTLRTLGSAWAALQESYTGLPDTALLEPGVAGDWSVRDVLAHVHTWQEEALVHLPEIAAGRTPGRYSATFGGIDAFNALMAERNRNLSLAGVGRRLEDAERLLVELIERTPEHLLGAETRFHRRLRLDTYGHYRLHAQGIREWRARAGAHHGDEVRL
jgi:hypothetical protein